MGLQNGAEFTSGKVAPRLKILIKTLEVLQKQKRVNATAATGTFSSNVRWSAVRLRFSYFFIKILTLVAESDHSGPDSCFKSMHAAAATGMV